MRGALVDDQRERLGIRQAVTGNDSLRPSTVPVGPVLPPFRLKPRVSLEWLLDINRFTTPGHC